jgi:hypothetical protein
MISGADNGPTADLSKLSGRCFPIFLGEQRSIWQGLPDSIPWEVIAPHERQANVNHGQSLETLARLGGLSPYELLAVLLDQAFWRCMLPEPATVIAKVKEKINGADAKRGAARI